MSGHGSLELGAKPSELPRNPAERVDEESAETLKSLVKDLEDAVCRAAVVGQMNADESSSINALLEPDELLPADILTPGRPL
jgi:hypothetical protein